MHDLFKHEYWEKYEFKFDQPAPRIDQPALRKTIPM